MENKDRKIVAAELTWPMGNRRGGKMKEITISVDGKEIKAQVSEEDIKKLQEPEWPQLMDKYWFVDDCYGPEWVYMEDDSVDKNRMALGNFYRTKEEAEDALRAQKLIAAVAKRRKELNGDWKPDWDYEGELKFFIASRLARTVDVYSSVLFEQASVFGCYKSGEDAESIIHEFRNELTWYFTEYLPSIN